MQKDWLANRVAPVRDVSLHVDDINVFIEREAKVASGNDDAIGLSYDLVDVCKAFERLNL